VAQRARSNHHLRAGVTFDVLVLGAGINGVAANDSGTYPELAGWLRPRRTFEVWPMRQALLCDVVR
jgi:hypothetical protein